MLMTDIGWLCRSLATKVGAMIDVLYVLQERWTSRCWNLLESYIATKYDLNVEFFYEAVRINSRNHH